MNCPNCEGHGVWMVSDEGSETSGWHLSLLENGVDLVGCFNTRCTRMGDGLIVCLMCNGSGALETA